MNLKYWEKVSPYFFSKKISEFSNCSNLFKIKVEKKKPFVNIFRLKKKKFNYKIYKNPIFLTQNSSQNCITNECHNLNFKNLYLRSYFPKIFFLKKLTPQLTFFKTAEIFEVHHEKNFKFYREDHFFFETDTLINWNVYLHFNTTFSNDNFNKSKVPLKFYKILFCIFLKKIKKFSIFLEKKKLNYRIPSVPHKILLEIESRATRLLSTYSFLINSLRQLINEIFFCQLYSFSKHLLFKIVSTEGTTFLNFTISLQTKKVFGIKEILNKIPLKRTKNLFQQVSGFLVQKKYHQEFIIHSLCKISPEKIFAGNLLIIFKCLLKIQEKFKVTGMNLVIYNLITTLKENMDLLLRFDYFFQTEIQFSPISCITIDKDVHFSICKKEKENKESLDFFSSGAFNSMGHPLYLKFFLIKILSRILKGPKQLIKIFLVEIIIKILKKTREIFFQKKKIIKKLQKNCSTIVKKSNIPRLFFFYKKKKTSSNHFIKKKCANLCLEKIFDKKPIVTEKLSANVNLFSFLEFNEES